jgi:hypothetical protein
VQLERYLNLRQKTSSHLERMLLLDMRRYSLCTSVSAVTVRPTADGSSWEVAEIYGPGGAVPPACRDICLTAAAELRKHYDLLPDSQLAPDLDLYLR